MTRFEDLEADWLSVEEARSRILERVRPTDPVMIPLEEALGTALAAPAEAAAVLPPWDNSAMDGYAVRAADVRGAAEASPVRLRVTGDVRAGDVPTVTVGPAEAVRIMTGAPVPPGADSVIRVEHTDREENPGTVEIRRDSDAGRNIRPAGEDMRPGDVLLEAGATLRAGQIGVLSALGATRVEVRRPPRVALLANGDELAPLESFDRVRAGRAVPETNTWTVGAQVREVGAEPLRLGIALDTAESIREHLRAARDSDTDALLTLAGASMGEADLFKRVLDEMDFELLFWRVRMRPGSPVSFGLLPRPGGPPLAVFGLPGNPASAFVTFHLFVRPFLLASAGHTRMHAPVVSATATAALSGPAHLAHFIRVRLAAAGRQLQAEATGAQGSGLVRSLASADGLALIPEGRGTIDAGDPVSVLLLGRALGWSADPGFTANPD